MSFASLILNHNIPSFRKSDKGLYESVGFCLDTDSSSVSCELQPITSELQFVQSPDFSCRSHWWCALSSTHKTNTWINRANFVLLFWRVLVKCWVDRTLNVASARCADEIPDYQWGSSTLTFIKRTLHYGYNRRPYACRLGKFNANNTLQSSGNYWRNYKKKLTFRLSHRCAIRAVLNASWNTQKTILAWKSDWLTRECGYMFSNSLPTIFLIPIDMPAWSLTSSQQSLRALAVLISCSWSAFTISATLEFSHRYLACILEKNCWRLSSPAVTTKVSFQCSFNILLVWFFLSRIDKYVTLSL